MHAEELVLLTGATGYVGSRLLGALRESGRRVRLLLRDSAAFPPVFSQGASIEVIRGDLLDRSSLSAALEGAHTAYYLVHSMNAPGSFEERDRQAAGNFASAARVARLKRIIYLGGLGSGPRLSKHLASRQEVGHILRESGVPVIEFRASVIIGPGSASFEMIRALVDGLPVMVVPRWVSTMTQPIAIDDVIAYLVAARDLELASSAVFEIGGPDRISYLDLMKAYARERGLHRVFLRVPVLTPTLSGLWLNLVTPLQARVGRRLIEGVRTETVVTNDSARRVFEIRPSNVEQAMARALAEEDRQFGEISWSTVLPLHPGGRDAVRSRIRSLLVDSRITAVPLPQHSAFGALLAVAGQPAWYCSSWPWVLRGYLDLAIGGPGMRCRQDIGPALAPGMRVGPWRVEALVQGSLVRLAAEMKLPGRAWLQFEVEPHEVGSQIRQTAVFQPLGILGAAYWYVLLPFHRPVFRALLREIKARAEVGAA
jgi:uncharacterized protein YbjT (DUF2867 family)